MFGYPLAAEVEGLLLHGQVPLSTHGKVCAPDGSKWALLPDAPWPPHNLKGHVCTRVGQVSHVVPGMSLGVADYTGLPNASGSPVLCSGRYLGTHVSS